MNQNYLLVFPYQVQNQAEFESIIDRFDEQDYIIHIFDDISPDNFDLDLLPIIIQEVIKENVQKNIRIVVCSNVREIIFSWYRFYNHIVHDFIYIINEFDSDLLTVKKEYNFYKQLFNFVGIQNEEIIGKIYININHKNYHKVMPFLFRNNNFRFFRALESLEFDNNIMQKKHKVRKEYLYNGYIYSFEKGNHDLPVRRIDFEEKSSHYLKDKDLLSELTEEPFFLYIYIKELLRTKHPNSCNIALYCFGLLQNQEQAKKEKILDKFLGYLNESGSDISFKEKAFFLSLLVMLNIKCSTILDNFMMLLLEDTSHIQYHYPIIYNILFYSSRDFMVKSDQYYFANRKEITKISCYMNQLNRKAFPPKYNQKKKKIAFLVDQLLLIKHSPTKVTLDYILYISKNYPEYEIQIFVEDNFISCPSEIIIPYYYSAAESEKFKNEHNKILQGYSVDIHYSDSTQGKAQRVCSMTQEICRFDPAVIITTSDISLTREILYPYYPIIYLSMGGFNYSTLADAYLQVNMKEAKAFYKRFPLINPEFIHEFKFGLDLPKASKIIKREEYGLSKDDFVLITVGNRLDAEMDEEFLLNICKLLEEKTNLKWLVVGKAELKFLKNNYQNLLGKKIIQISYENDLMALYDICDVYLNPRRHGGGISIAMAMQQGLPVVIFSNQSDGLIYVGEENGIGYDYSSYLNEIEKLYTDSTYRTKKGDLMKERISSFRMDYSVENLFDLINIACRQYHCRINTKF